MYWVKQTLSSVHNPHIIENKTLHIIQGNIPHAKDEVTTGCLLLTRIFVKIFISYQCLPQTSKIVVDALICVMTLLV